MSRELEAPDLESLLSRLVRSAAEPRLASFARKMIELLQGIRRDFDGDVRDQLEAMVAETLSRQVAISEHRARADEALSELCARQDELVGALNELLLRLAPDEGATRH